MTRHILSFLILAGFQAAFAGPLSSNTINSTRSNVHSSNPRLLGRRLSATSQFLDCYDYTNLGGNYLRMTDYVPALGNYNFDNRIESCCFTGIWILFAEQNYNSYSTGASNWWAYGDNYCSDVPVQFANMASSIRFTGAPDDWKFGTLNLYFNDYFIGDEESMYQYDNYQGYAMCVFPGDTSSCTPGFYTTSNSLGSLSGQVSSARKGCYAKERVMPDNFGARTRSGANGAQGFFPGQ